MGAADQQRNLGDVVNSAVIGVKPVTSHPWDAEPVMRHDAEGHTSYIVVGRGPSNGGYTIEFIEQGENRVRYR